MWRIKQICYKGIRNTIDNDKTKRRTYWKHILCNQLSTRPRKRLTSLNNSSGDLEDESKAVRDQMQIGFISVKPETGVEEVESTPRRKHAAGSTPAFGGLLLRGYINPYRHLSLSRVHLHFILVLILLSRLTNAEILENSYHSTEIKLRHVCSRCVIPKIEKNGGLICTKFSKKNIIYIISICYISVYICIIYMSLYICL